MKKYLKYIKENKNKLKNLLSLGIFGVFVLIFILEIRSIPFEEIRGLYKSLSPRDHLVLAALGTGIFSLTTLYDYVLKREFEVDLSPSQVFKMEFVANSYNNLVSLGGVSGMKVRHRDFSLRILSLIISIIGLIIIGTIVFTKGGIRGSITDLGIFDYSDIMYIALGLMLILLSVGIKKRLRVVFWTLNGVLFTVLLTMIYKGFKPFEIIYFVIFMVVVFTTKDLFDLWGVTVDPRTLMRVLLVFLLSMAGVFLIINIADKMDLRFSRALVPLMWIKYRKVRFVQLVLFITISMVAYIYINGEYMAFKTPSKIRLSNLAGIYVQVAVRLLYSAIFPRRQDGFLQ